MRSQFQQHVPAPNAYSSAGMEFMHVLNELPLPIFSVLSVLPDYDVNLYFRNRDLKYLERSLSPIHLEILRENLEAIIDVLEHLKNITLIDKFIDWARQRPPFINWVKYWEK